MDVATHKLLAEKRRHLPWLYKELPTLQAKGVLDTDAVLRLKEYYGETPRPAMSRAMLFMMLLAILGAVMVGGGIIMLIAHNWDELARPNKLALAFTPLIISTVLGIYTLAAEKSPAWRESVPLFISLSAATAISLVAQTYHISGDFPRFMMTWMLLTLPLVYLFRSTSTAVFYLILLCWWLGAAIANHQESWPFWLMLAAYVPFLAKQWDIDCDSGSVVWQKWALAGICIFVPGFLSTQSYMPFTWRLNYLLVFLLLYLFSILGQEEEECFWRRPFANIGLAGLAVVMANLCLRYSWNFSTGNLSEFLVSPFANTAFLTLLVVVWLGMTYYLVSNKRYYPLIWAALPLLPLIMLTIARGTDNSFPATICSIYLFAAGLTTLVIGYRADQWLKMNGGMVVAMFPVLVKFFDDSFSFISKGLCFIVLGLILLTVNLTFARNRARTAKTVREGGAA